jgi:subtilisin family serine protease
MKKSIFKNTALATILSSTLAACGGGGGGSGVGVIVDPPSQPSFETVSFSSAISGQLVGDFVSMVHTLTQDEVLDVKDTLEIFQWVETNESKFNGNDLSGYKITVDGQEMSLDKGFNMLLGFKRKYYDGKEAFWINTANTGQLDDENEDYLALKSTALKDLEKQEEDKQSYFDELEQTGKATVVRTESTTDTKHVDSDNIPSETVTTYSDWILASSQPGETSVSTVTENETTITGAVYEVITETSTTPTIANYTRTKTDTISYTKERTTTVITTTYTVFSNGVKSEDVSKSVTTSTVAGDADSVTNTSEGKTETIDNDPVVTVTRTLITNPIVSTTALDPTETETVTEGAEYSEDTVTWGDTESTYTEEGSATTDHTYTYTDTDVDNGDGTLTRTNTKYTVTTTVTPVTTYTTKVKTTLTKVYKDVTTTTTITPRTKNTYADGTEEIVNGTASETQAIVKTFVSESENSTTEIVDQVVNNTTTTETDSGQVVSVTTISTTYTDLDPNLGTKTVGYDTDKTTYETDEYQENSNGFAGGSAKQVNASSAYSRGWTGKGSIVAVADTGYDTDHTEFDGQVIATRDYYGNGIQDNHGHGSHVLGTIVAKKDGTGTHGVAYDAKAVVIKIGDQRSVSLDNAASGFSWAADQGAIVGNLSANSNYDSGFRNSITKIADDTYKTTSPYYDYENGTYYNNMTPDTWKAATDKGLVLVNSAGNQGLDISAMPGWFATETDADGNLVLGGKVLIVGSYNFNANNLDSWTNKAGHLCRVIVDNACTDTYKTSDFYVLAPGNTYSTNNEGSYDTMSGTSMAAPIVTGQVAVLHQMWPHMKGENLVKLVTTTANKDITGYDVNIHGQGIVDFDEATKPQGAIGIPTTGRVDGAVSSISTTSASGSGSMGSAISNVQIMVLDEFDRDYYMNLGNSFTVQDNRKYSDVEMLVDNKNTFLPHQQMYGSFAQGGQYDLAKNYNFGLYTGENGNGDYSLNVGKDFYLNDKFKLKTSVGYMSEQETWLGNTSEGVLAVGDNNDTTSANIGVSYQLGNNVLTLDYSKGSTDINTTNGSLIRSFSDVETESYRLAYEIHKDTHTTFGWSFSLPSHITSGTMDLEVAESVNLDGTINYTNINSDLAQGTKEKNIGFYYNKSGEEELDASFNFTAEYRTDKSGVADNDGVEMAVKMVKKFAGSCKFLWMKNPKCFDEDGNMKSNLFGTSIDNATKHGLVYDLKTDKFIPIKK